MALLTKSDILRGIDEPRKITIKTLGGEVYLRPLSSAELNDVTNIEAEAYGNIETTSKGKRDPNATSRVNLSKMNKATAQAKYKAIFISINNPKNEEPWTEEEIQRLHDDQVEELYDNVMEISGAGTTKEDVKTFPEDE